MITILANDGLDKSAADELKALGYEVDLNKYQGEDLHNRLKEVEAIIIRSATKLRQPEIDAAAGGKLKLIIRAGVGIDNIDHVYAKEKGIEVRNTPAASSRSVAELALGSMFALARHLHASNVTMKKGEWNKKAYSGIELGGKTLGLIGFGRIARELAKMAKAIGMDVVYTKRSGAIEGETEYRYLPKEELLKVSDFVSLHVPFKAGSTPIIGKPEIEMMKDGAFIVNTARGGAVCENSLLEALDSGKISAAALDVFTEEPLRDERIMNHPGISLTPHIGAATSEAQFRIGEEIVSIVKETF